MKFSLFNLLANLVLCFGFLLSVSALATHAEPTIDEAAAACMSERLTKQSLAFHYLDSRGKPYHQEKSVYTQVECEDSEAARAYFKAASKHFTYKDEDYAKDLAKPTRRVFHRVKGSDLLNMCFFDGPEEKPTTVLCYFNMAIPGTAK